MQPSSGKGRLGASSGARIVSASAAVSGLEYPLTDPDRRSSVFALAANENSRTTHLGRTAAPRNSGPGPHGGYYDANDEIPAKQTGSAADQIPREHWSE